MFTDILNKEIENAYIITIESTTIVHEWLVNEGEGEFKNEFTNNAHTVTTTAATIKEDIVKEIVYYINNVLYLDKSDATIRGALEDMSYDDTYFYMTEIVDEDNIIASDEELAEWEKSEHELYIADNMISVRVNGVDIKLETIAAAFAA